MKREDRELYSWFWCGGSTNSEIIKNSDLLRIFVLGGHKLKAGILFVFSEGLLLVQLHSRLSVRPAASCTAGVWWPGAGLESGSFPALLLAGVGCADSPLPPVVASAAMTSLQSPSPVSPTYWGLALTLGVRCTCICPPVNPSPSRQRIMEEHIWKYRSSYFLATYILGDYLKPYMH